MNTKIITIILCLAVCIITPTVFILYTSPVAYLYIVGIPCSFIIGGALLIRWIRRMEKVSFKINKL